MSKELGSSTTAKKSWFGNLSTKRKLVYLFLLLFVVAWCFFLGFHAAGMWEQHKADAAAEYKISGADLNDENDAYIPTDLSGFRTVLLVGYDIREGYEVGRSDTIMVSFLNLDDKSVKLLSIPRDSYVYIPGGFGNTKINHAFSLGGITLVKETVEYLLGITIDDYVCIDFQGFQDVVDALGGIEVYVESDMINWDEGIELYTGTHVLNGKEALGFVRYRGPDCSDYDRIKHQQYMLYHLFRKLLSISTVTKVGSLVDIFMNNVDTTISRSDMLKLARFAFSVNPDTMKVYTVPGYSMYLEYGGYWLSHEIIDRSELTSILNKIAGDDIEFSPNVIDPGDMGSYTIPEGGEEYIDDSFFSGGDSGEYEGEYEEESGDGGYEGGGEESGGESSGGESSGGEESGGEASGSEESGGEDFGPPVDNGDTVDDSGAGGEG